jgi:hypothetical protein
MIIFVSPGRRRIDLIKNSWSFGPGVNMKQMIPDGKNNNGGHHYMPSIPVNSLEPNPHAVLTTAVAFVLAYRL